MCGIYCKRLRLCLWGLLFFLDFSGLVGGDVCLVLGCFHFNLVEVHQGGAVGDTLYIIIGHNKCALTGSERTLTYKF